MFEKGSTGSRHLYDAPISSEEQKSKFALKFPDRPAEVGLRDVESPCRPAEVQFAHHSQGEYQFLEWGSQAHVFTAKMEWSVPIAGVSVCSRVPVPTRGSLDGP
jgi:hypothetical protein